MRQTACPASTSASRSARARRSSAVARSGADEPSAPVGWGRRRSRRGRRAAILDVALAPDARLAFGRWELAAAAVLDAAWRRDPTSPDGTISIRQLPSPDVRVTVRVTRRRRAGAGPGPLRGRGRPLPAAARPSRRDQPGHLRGHRRRPRCSGARHLRLRPGRVPDRPAPRRRRRRGRQGLRPPPGPDHGRGRARTRETWRSTSTARSTCGPPAGGPPTRTSTSWRRRRPSSRRPPRTSTFVHVLATQLGDHFINVPGPGLGLAAATPAAGTR